MNVRNIGLSKIFGLTASFFVVLGYQNCGKMQVNSDLVQGLSSTSVEYSAQAKAILQPKCFSCHNGQIAADLTSASAAVISNYIDLKNPTNSTLLTSLQKSSIDLGFKRIEGFLGRSDNMIKLRGINIYPQGLAPVLEQNNAYAGEFICVAERAADGRDELTVRVEVRDGLHIDAALASAFEELLKQRFGVQMKVALAAVGSLAPLTCIETRQKPIRLIDRRFL